MSEPNLIFPLSPDISAVLEAAEDAEFWAMTSRSFLEKQRMLFARLTKENSSLPRDEFLHRFITVAAFSSFRDSFALLHALGRRQPRMFTSIVGQASGKGFAFVPEEYCNVLRWRIRYATAFSVMSRVFSTERTEMICKALRRAQ